MQSKYATAYNFKFYGYSIAVFSRMRGNRILERLTVQDCNTPHSCDYRYKILNNQEYPEVNACNLAVSSSLNSFG